MSERKYPRVFTKGESKITVYHDDSAIFPNVLDDGWREVTELPAEPVEELMKKRYWPESPVVAEVRHKSELARLRSRVAELEEGLRVIRETTGEGNK